MRRFLFSVSLCDIFTACMISGMISMAVEFAMDCCASLGVSLYTAVLDFELLSIARPLRAETLQERLAQPSSGKEVAERLRGMLKGADERDGAIQGALQRLSTEELKKMIADLEWCTKAARSITYPRYRQSKGASMAERLQIMRATLASLDSKGKGTTR